VSEIVQLRSLTELQPRELKQFASDLPTLPVVFQELFSRMQDPDTQISELAEVIARDPALTAKILKLVNSAFYGRPSQITTISRAVIIMGFQAVRSAALAVSVFDHFKDLPALAAGFDLERFWRHDVAVSCVAKQLALVLGAGEPEDAFVAGLLHDVGKLVMLQHFPRDVDDLAREVSERRLTWRAGESALFAIDHAELGRTVFRAWDFPESVVEAVGRHHEPDGAGRHAVLAALVHLADYFSYHLDAGCPGGVAPRLHSQDAARMVGLTPERASEALQRASGELAESLEILKLLD